TNNACPNDTMIFYAFGGSHYVWSFDDGTTTSVTTPLTVMGNDNGGNYSFTIDITRHAFATLGDHEVVLTYYNECGNYDKDTIIVTVGSSEPVDGDMGPLLSTYNTCEEIPFLGFGGGTYKWIFAPGDTLVTTQSS